MIRVGTPYYDHANRPGYRFHPEKGVAVFAGRPPKELVGNGSVVMDKNTGRYSVEYPEKG